MSALTKFMFIGAFVLIACAVWHISDKANKENPIIRFSVSTLIVMFFLLIGVFVIPPMVM